MEDKQFKLNGKTVWLVKSKVQTDDDYDSCDEDNDSCDEDNDSCDEDNDSCDEDNDSCDACVFDYSTNDGSPYACPFNSQKGMLECTLGEGVMHFTDTDSSSLYSW